jgi:hypothetical protein
MKRIAAGCVLLVFASLISSAGAAVFARDWKTPGDGLLTYDDVNRREWLDVTVSRLDQFPAPRLENAIAEITPGGLFEGFTFAKRADVRAFAQSGGIDTSTTDIAVNHLPTVEMIDLVGATFEQFAIKRSVGIVNEVQTSHTNAPPYDAAAFLTNSGGFAGLLFFLPDDLLRPTTNGLMLYRNVPEPASLILALIGVPIVMYTARQRKLRA